MKTFICGHEIIEANIFTKSNGQEICRICKNLKYKTPQNLTRVITEIQEDKDSKLNYTPNGDDIHHFNLGYGNRWVKNGLNPNYSNFIRSERIQEDYNFTYYNLLHDKKIKKEEKSHTRKDFFQKYLKNDLVILLPEKILCKVLDFKSKATFKNSSNAIYQVKILSTSEIKWVNKIYLLSEKSSEEI